MPKNLTGFLKDAPNLFGDIARFINLNLETDQPGISLATSLAFMGALRSQRISNEYGIAPNIYTCAVSPSGTGKSRAQQIISDICERCELSHIIMGQPTSDAGLRKALVKEPRRILIWDEFGIALSALSKSSQAYHALILSCMMELFSKAGKLYKGKEYAKDETIDVKDPYLSVCAVSTPNRFFDALNKEFIEDGFLGRWLTFHGATSVKFKEAPREIDIPYDILTRVKEINTGSPSVSRNGNLASSILPEPKKLRYEFSEQLEMIREERNAALEGIKSEIDRVFWVRAFELTVKVCMAVSDEDNYLTDTDVQYSWNLVKYLLDENIQRCTLELHDTPRDKDEAKRYKKFLNLISINEQVTKTELTKRATNKQFKPQEREARTAELLETGVWEFSSIYNSDTKRNSETFTRRA